MWWYFPAIWIGFNVLLVVALLARPERRPVENQREMLQRLMREHRCDDCSGSR